MIHESRGIFSSLFSFLNCFSISLFLGSSIFLRQSQVLLNAIEGSKSPKRIIRKVVDQMLAQNNSRLSLKMKNNNLKLSYCSRTKTAIGSAIKAKTLPRISHSAKAIPIVCPGRLISIPVVQTTQTQVELRERHVKAIARQKKLSIEIVNAKIKEENVIRKYGRIIDLKILVKII